jgi:hypothetical protein
MIPAMSDGACRESVRAGADTRARTPGIRRSNDRRNESAAAQNLAGQVGEIAFSDRTSIDWGSVAKEGAIAAAAGFVGGKLARTIGNGLGKVVGGMTPDIYRYIWQHEFGQPCEPPPAFYDAAGTLHVDVTRVDIHTPPR